MWFRLGLASIAFQLFLCPSNALTQQTGITFSDTSASPIAQPVEASRDRTSSAAPEPVIASPIQGVETYQLHDSFDKIHHGHRHEAIDIAEPEGTPVRAVVDGTIQKLFFSKAGGITIYEFDGENVYCYYYAHLERYADGLGEGMRVSRGEVIGYVGSTGDASPNAPHLHFAIYLLGPQRRWWKGAAIDPYPVLERSLTVAPRSSSKRVYIILEMLHAAG